MRRGGETVGVYTRHPLDFPVQSKSPDLYFCPIMKIVFTLAFIGNVLFMPLCMFPTMAADLPMQHAEAMEMIMTPMETMTHAVMTPSTSCDHCAHVQKQQPPPMNAGCAGHCLSQAGDALGTLAMGSSSILADALLPPPTSIVAMAEDRGQSWKTPQWPPGVFISTRTIVLLE